MVQLDGSRIRLAVSAVLALFTILIGTANADYVFGTPAVLGPPVNSAADDASQVMSPDGLELYFDSGRAGYNVWVAKRATASDPWGEPERLWFTVDTPAIDFGPSLSADGLTLYYSSNRGGPFNTWIATRETISDPWGAPVNIGPPVSSSAGDFGPCISADGLELFFGSPRPGGSGDTDLWVTKRETIHDPWREPVNLGVAVNSPAGDNSPIISADGLLLFFESNRAGGHGDFDIWFTRRTTPDDDWGPAVNLGPPVNSARTEFLPGISPDGSRFDFVIANHPDGYGGYDIWQVVIEPVVDFDGNGAVDAVDIDIMIDCWGTDEPLCDIGPTPWGDGVVDVEDLIVLVEHMVTARADVEDTSAVE
jgi:Tol biopolymer transport system component